MTLRSEARWIKVLTICSLIANASCLLRRVSRNGILCSGGLARLFDGYFDVFLWVLLDLENKINVD